MIDQSASSAIFPRNSTADACGNYISGVCEPLDCNDMISCKSFLY